MLCTGPAAAQEFVDVPGRLDDEAFYRAVACGAAPGAACTKPFIRWPEARRRPLTVSLTSPSGGLPGDLGDRFDAAVDAALDEVNGLDAGVRLARAEAAGDIEVHVVATPPNHVMRGTGVPDLEGQILPLARVALRAQHGDIVDGLIAVSAFARPEDIPSVLLEEITQALGLMTDIRGPAYRGSLFAEDGNSVTRLAGQDAMAVRRHYAPDSNGDG
jgi:hypothetical protein